ncbi:hypothetical protein [Wolbachia endosymbiont (group A) of Bibio marci]|nr:hypothetical protein [Wolbachia endosymbiont (group A) of Bibio marci]
MVWLNSKWLHEFIVNYYQYKVRCNKARWNPVSTQFNQNAV